MKFLHFLYFAFSFYLKKYNFILFTLFIFYFKILRSLTIFKFNINY